MSRLQFVLPTEISPKVNAAPAAPQRPRPLLCVDALRGIAAVAVMLFHANGFFWRGTQGPAVPTLLFGYGHLGVSLFFLISGFCIHLPNAASNRPLNWKTFAIRRFFRLYPTYLLVVVGCMLLVALQTKLVGGGPNEATWANFAGHLIFWHYFVPANSSAMGISPVLWSIAIEVHFYVLYALLLPVLRRVGIGRCAVLALILGILYRLIWARYNIHVVGAWQSLEPHRFAVARFGEWLLGAWIAGAYAASSSQRVTAAFSGRSILISGLTLLGAVVLIDWFSSHGLGGWIDIPSAFAFALIIWGWIMIERAQGVLPSPGVFLRAGKWFGDRSYSLYLVHFTAIAALGTAYAIALHVTNKDTLRGTWPLAVVAAAGIAISVFLANYLYRFVERPSHRLARQLSKPRPDANAARREESIDVS